MTVRAAGEPRARRLSPRHAPRATALLLGALAVTAHAPLGFWPLAVLAPAALMTLWRAAPDARQSGAIGFAFGLGYFLAGVSWVYVSLHDFGAMPAPVAAAVTLGFCAYLALYPAAAGYCARRLHAGPAASCLLLMPALWTALEWTRGWLFTGFPWLALGYSQIPASPLAGYAPVAGIYGLTLVTAFSAGVIALLWERARGTASRPAQPVLRALIHPATAALLAVWISGWGLRQVAWTAPVGEPITVSLIQGNVPQDMKWREDRLISTLALYRDAVLAAEGRLIILPETALPLFLRDVPRDYLDALASHVAKRGGNVLIGVPERQPGGDYYNSVVSVGSDPAQAYRKIHLVPFGEFIPLRPVLAWIVNVLSIPLQDFARGAETQRPLAVSGQQVAVNVCYEDAFGEEIIRQLPEATLLVNVSNVAWFGRSIAPRQHLQIAQARALETGRYMLRATNTGMTAIVNPRGEVERVAPEFTATTLTHAVRGHSGATPYVRWGNAPALALCAAMLAAGGLYAALRQRRAPA